MWRPREPKPGLSLFATSIPNSWAAIHNDKGLRLRKVGIHMPIIRVRISNQTAHFLELVFTLGLGIISLYLAFFGVLVTLKESILLIASSIAHFYFFRKVSRYEVTLWGWSLPSIIWAIPAFYSIWMVIFITSIRTIGLQPTPTPNHSYTYPTSTPRSYPTSTARYPTLPTWFRDCIPWLLVTPQDEGKYLCVWGIVDGVYGLENQQTRIDFSPEPNTFFMVDPLHYYPDLGHGDCIASRDYIKVFDTIPYMQVS